MTLLKVEDLSVFYGQSQVLWEVSAAVAEGEITTIVGANGAGKSTLLKSIVGLVQPAAGSIAFAGRSTVGLKPSQVVEQGVVLVPESRLLFPEMTVLENLEMGSYLPRAKERRRQSLEFVYGLFPILAERREQIAGTLSGGQQQMLAIARGLMSLPKLLMLDEISLGVAPHLVQELFKVVKQINQEGMTVLLVEQNLVQALNISDRGYVLENGRIVLRGTSSELLENPHVKKAYLGI